MLNGLEGNREDKVLLMTKYDGTVKDDILNPVYAILKQYDKLSRGEILSEITDWNFGADPEKLFNQAVESKLITETNNKFHLTQSTPMAAASSINHKEILKHL